MKYLLIAFLLAGTLTLIFSCAGSKKTKLDKDKGISQQVLLGYNFRNQAWGYQNSGKYIDKDGMLKEFKVGKADRNNWNLPEGGYIGKEELMANYARATTEAGTMSEEKINEIYALTKQLANSEISYDVVKQQRFDFGSHEYHAYFWDKETGKYRAILLSLSDTRQDKTIKNEEGQKLIELMSAAFSGVQLDR